MEVDYSNEEIDNIEVKTFYRYKKISPTRYIHIYKSGIGTNKLKISELKIFKGIDEINYQKECFNCDVESLKYLNDNNYEKDKQFTMDFKNGYLIIDLIDEYELDNLTINIYLNDNTVELKKYYIGFSNTKNDNKFIANKFIYEDIKTNDESLMFKYKIDNSWNVNENLKIEYETDELLDNSIFFEKIG